MNKKKRENQRQNYKALISKLQSEGKLQNQKPCMNCGGWGPHFVPPSFGDEGFFSCTKKDN